jgi:hypothetical protein
MAKWTGYGSTSTAAESSHGSSSHYSHSPVGSQTMGSEPGLPLYQYPTSYSLAGGLNNPYATGADTGAGSGNGARQCHGSLVTPATSSDPNSAYGTPSANYPGWFWDGHGNHIDADGNYPDSNV